MRRNGVSEGIFYTICYLKPVILVVESSQFEVRNKVYMGSLVAIIVSAGLDDERSKTHS